MNSYMLEVFVVYTLCVIHLITLSELYSIMHYIIQIRVLVIRWLTLEILMQLILLSIIQVLFFSRVKATGTYNNIVHNATIDNLLTLRHLRSDISYIEGFDGSDIDDLIELVATL